MEINLKENSGACPPFAIRVLNLSELEEPIESPQRSPLGSSPHAEDIVPWYGGDNLFAQRLAERARTSSTHAGILASKIALTTGDGFNFSGRDGTRAEVWAKSVNPDGESLGEVWSRAAADWWHFGNVFLEVTVPKSGALPTLRHLDATTCRLVRGAEGLATGVCIRPQWSGLPALGRKPPVVPLWPNSAPSPLGQRSIFHVKRYAPQYAWYGLPDYIAAYWNGWLDIDYRIPRFNLARFKNGFRPGGLLFVEGNFADKESISAFVDEIAAKTRGEENAGQLLALVTADEGLKPKFIPWEDAPDGAFESLQRLCVQNIITAHRWSPSLCGIQVAGALGSNQQVRLEHERVMSSVIKPDQDMLLRPIAKLLQKAGFALDSIAISNLTPLSYFGDLPIADLITREEGREHLGYKG